MSNGICPSPPTDHDESDGDNDNNGEMVDIYYKTELIRLYLCLQQFTTTTGSINELTEEQDQELCALWDTINSISVASFYLEHDMMDVLGLILTQVFNSLSLNYNYNSYLSSQTTLDWPN